MFLGRRERTARSLHSSCTRRENLKKCLVQPCCRCTSIWKSSQDMLPSDNGSAEKRGKKGKNPLTGVVCPLTTGVLISVRHCMEMRPALS